MAAAMGWVLSFSTDAASRRASALSMPALMPVSRIWPWVSVPVLSKVTQSME